MTRSLTRLLLSGLVVAAALMPARSVAGAASQVPTNWAMERFDNSRAGVNPYENVLSTENVDELSEAWSMRIGDGRTFGENPSPAVWNGFVYAGGADGLAAYDAETGERTWHRRFEVDSSPAVADGVLYVGITDLSHYAVVAVATETGKTLWKFPTSWLIRSSPAVADGVVYVASESGWMYAVDAASGRPLWERRLSDRYEYMTTPALGQGNVYLIADGRVAALDASTGKPLWQFTCGDFSNVSPAVVDGVVYVGGIVLDRGIVCAMDADTGAGIWYRVPGGLLDSASLANGVLYVSGYLDIRAFDAATGDTLWTQDIGMRHEPAIPVIADGRLYLAVEDESVHAFALP